MIIRLKGKKFNLPSVLRCKLYRFFYCAIDFRNPKKGEYFVSGAIPEIYQAPSDMSLSYLIVHLKSKAVPKTIYTERN